MRLVVGILWTLLAVGPAAAQSGLKPNEMVKVELMSNEVLRGKVLRLTRDSLVFSDYARVMSIPSSDIRSVATYHRNWWSGIKRGAKVGAVVGGVLIAAGAVADVTYCRRPGSECMMPYSVGGIAAAFHTTWVGAGIGFLTAPGGWRTPRPWRDDRPATGR